MKIKFSDNLRAMRNAENLKQAELAKKLGVTQRKVSYWETGKIEPDIEDLWKLADFFCITVDELIGRQA